MTVLKSIIEQQVESYRLVQQAKKKKRQKDLIDEQKSIEKQIYLQQRNNNKATDHATDKTADEHDKTYIDTLSSLRRLRMNKYDTTIPTTDGSVSWSYPLVPSDISSHSETQVMTPFFYNSSATISSPPPPLPLKGRVRVAEEKIEVEHKSRHSTESGLPLRTTFLPSQLQEEFLEIARPNTIKNLETCGVLCGKLNRNAFFITHLVIPDQESTSDTCQTTNEEKLFEYIDQNDLFILGWIHTHPSQTCFLSSVDLHTQSSYQIMLPEAVAIVLAPKHEPSWGIFRLTDPPGIEIIKKCKQSSTFHPHDEPASVIYKTAYNPGHITKTSGLPFTVQDLR